VDKLVLGFCNIVDKLVREFYNAVDKLVRECCNVMDKSVRGFWVSGHCCVFLFTCCVFLCVSSRCCVQGGEDS